MEEQSPGQLLLSGAGGVREELSWGVTPGPGSPWAPCGTLVPLPVGGRSQSVQVCSLPRPQEGGYRGQQLHPPHPPSHPHAEGWPGRQVGESRRRLSQCVRNVLAAPSCTLPLPAPTSPLSPGAVALSPCQECTFS